MRYSPHLCIEAEILFSEGKYSECLQKALEAHEKARQDEYEKWQEFINNPPSELARLTKMWDTTTQKYLNYEDYKKYHNWEDDIPPAPLKIATKAKKN